MSSHGSNYDFIAQSVTSLIDNSVSIINGLSKNTAVKLATEINAFTALFDKSSKEVMIAGKRKIWNIYFDILGYYLICVTAGCLSGTSCHQTLLRKDREVRSKLLQMFMCTGESMSQRDLSFELQNSIKSFTKAKYVMWYLLKRAWKG